MNVGELIVELSKLPNNAKIMIEGYDVLAEDIRLEESFLSSPDNQIVVFKSGASETPEELKEKDRRLYKLIRDIKLRIGEEE